MKIIVMIKSSKYSALWTHDYLDGSNFGVIVLSGLCLGQNPKTNVILTRNVIIIIIIIIIITIIFIYCNWFLTRWHRKQDNWTHVKQWHDKTIRCCILWYIKIRTNFHPNHKTIRSILLTSGKVASVLISTSW